jgi:hypothetical protein
VLINDDLDNEDPLFVDHRHDQSVLSLLYKKLGLKPFQIVYQKNFGSIRNSMQPLWLSRNRTGDSVLKPIVNSNITAIAGSMINSVEAFHFYMLKITKKSKE